MSPESTGAESARTWHDLFPAVVRPYLQTAPLAALFLGISSGFPYAMIGATLTTRLAQDGIDKRSVTQFALAFLVYNFKPFWAWIIDGVRIPVLGRLGQRVSWMLLSGCMVIAAVCFLASVEPSEQLLLTAVAAIAVGFAGATFDIVIDAYRIELLKPEQLGVGSGMSQYGWRIGSAAAGALALVVAGRYGWTLGYLVCASFAFPAMLTALIVGEPPRHRAIVAKSGLQATITSIVEPLADFLKRRGAWLILLFILVHKIGDTLANLSLRLLFNDLGYSNDDIAIYDVGFGFWAFLIGIFFGGWLYNRLGMQRSVLLSLFLMAVSNLSFAGLAAYGENSNWLMAGAIGFENFASGVGGVTVVAYFSALCNLQFTAFQYALISSGASVLGRLFSGTTTGALIEGLGYVQFYLLTTLVALPGLGLFWYMQRAGYADPTQGHSEATPRESDTT